MRFNSNTNDSFIRWSNGDSFDNDDNVALIADIPTPEQVNLNPVATDFIIDALGTRAIVQFTAAIHPAPITI